MGPSAFRIAGIGERIAALGYQAVDKGDVPAPIPETQKPADERKKYIDEIATVCRRLYEVSLKALDAGALPVVLGGDHSLAAGSVAASAAWVRRTSSRPLGLSNRGFSPRFSTWPSRWSNKANQARRSHTTSAPWPC